MVITIDCTICKTEYVRLYSMQYRNLYNIYFNIVKIMSRLYGVCMHARTSYINKYTFHVGTHLWCHFPFLFNLFEGLSWVGTHLVAKFEIIALSREVCIMLARDLGRFNKKWSLKFAQLQYDLYRQYLTIPHCSYNSSLSEVATLTGQPIHKFGCNRIPTAITAPFTDKLQ